MRYSLLSEYMQKDLVDRHDFPWTHWSIKHFFSADYLSYFKAILPEDLDPDLVYDDNRSALRITRNTCVKFPFLEKIVQFFQVPENVNFFAENAEPNAFKDCYVRIDYTLDHPGYELKPHLDRHSKLLTFQVYLPQKEEEWGTELYDTKGLLCKTVPFMNNCGWFTLPQHGNKAKWHGVTRPVTKARPTVLVNYIRKPETLDVVKGDARPDGTNVTLSDQANVWEDWWSL